MDRAIVLRNPKPMRLMHCHPSQCYSIHFSDTECFNQASDYLSSLALYRVTLSNITLTCSQLRRIVTHPRVQKLSLVNIHFGHWEGYFAALPNPMVTNLKKVYVQGDTNAPLDWVLAIESIEALGYKSTMAPNTRQSAIIRRLPHLRSLSMDVTHGYFMPSLLGVANKAGPARLFPSLEKLEVNRPHFAEDSISVLVELLHRVQFKYVAPAFHTPHAEKIFEEHKELYRSAFWAHLLFLQAQRSSDLHHSYFAFQLLECFGLCRGEMRRIMASGQRFFSEPMSQADSQVDASLDLESALL